MTEIEDIYPLTPLQQGLLFHSLLSPSANLYCVALSLRIEGLDPAAFRRAWHTVVEQHSVLRTSFHWEGLEQPLQIVHKGADLPWVEVDWRSQSEEQQAASWEQLLSAERRSPFKLTHAPLLRITLARLDDSRFRLLWSHHHLLLDGWSSSLVVRDLLTAYADHARNRSPQLKQARPFRDYLAWLQGYAADEAESFWRARLSGRTNPTPLPLTPGTGTDCIAEDYFREVSVELEDELTSAAIALARHCKVTLNSVVQGAFGLLLSRYSREGEVVFGVTTSGRPADLPGVEDMIGLFINTVPVRLNVPHDLDLKSWLKHVFERQSEAQQFEYTPLGQIQAWSDSGGGVPLFDALYVFENYPISQAISEEAEALRIDEVQSFDWSNYPVTLVVIPGERLRFLLLHDTRRFGSDAARRLLGHLVQLLRVMPTSVNAPLSRLPVLSDSERRQLLCINQTAKDFPREAGIASLFDAVAELFPDRTAITWGNKNLSYRQLQHRADRIAVALITSGVLPGSRVAVHMPRSADFVTVLLAVLKAGAAYVPLDVSYPKERLKLMLEDSMAGLVVTAGVSLGPLGVAELDFAQIDDVTGRMPEELICIQRGGGDLAYVIYTSGSTGTPKGVAVPQRAVVRLVKNTDYVNLGPEDRVAQASNASFDAATFEIWGALLNGGTLVGVERDDLLSPTRLADFLSGQAVSAMFLTTALFNQVAFERPAAFNSLKHLLFGGESVDPRAVAAVLDAGGPERLLHVYGPTENTTFSTWQLIREVPIGANNLPIGKPIANSTLYLLDHWGDLVPIGVPGEIYVGGDGVALGYFNQSVLSARCFVRDPFDSRPGARLYRTGDLARYLHDGSVEFIGRTDSQVKIRGFRVELGEVESALLGYSQVREAIAHLEQGRLAAYLVTADEIVLEDLQRYLANYLPNFMIPQDFFVLESLPLSINGKVDRTRLPKVPQSADEIGDRAKTPQEELIAGIWAKVLGRSNVGRDEDFFELGGHSLLATQVVSRVREAFGVELSLSQFFHSPTVAGLARALLAASNNEYDVAPSISKIPRSEGMSLSFAQERLWFLDQLEPGNPFYNIPIALRLLGSLDLDALALALNTIVARHEVLRTHFPALQGKPIQLIDDCLKFELSLSDLSNLGPNEKKETARSVMVAEARAHFDLERGPLVRPRVLRLDSREHLFLLTVHHIVADGWSLGVLVNELAPIYARIVAGDQADTALPDIPIQYADFADWQRTWLSGPLLERQLNYWKQQLNGAPPALQLYADRPRPPVQSYRGSSLHFRVDSSIAEGLNRVSRENGATLFMSLLSVFSTLLYRLSGQDDMVIGSPIANRNHIQIEPLIGFFVNTLALRVDLSGAPRFSELLARVRGVALDAYAHQDLPFEKLVDEIQPERDLSLNPLFQVMFALHNAPLKRLSLPGLEAELLDNPRIAALFDLVLDMWEDREGLGGVLEYNTDLFDHGTVARIIAHYLTLLKSVVDAPDTPIDDMPLMTEAQRAELLEMGDGPRRAYPVAQPVHALFSSQARRCGDRIAATHRTESISYSELDAASNRIARRLRRLGVDRGSLVGILDERGLEFLFAMLGVLKAGAAFVPLDPGYPTHRLQHMLRDSGIKVLVTRRTYLAGLSALPEKALLLMLDDDDWKNESSHSVESGSSSKDLAYVLYTSGSTGHPKGAMLRHEGVVNHIFAEFESLRFHQGTVFLQSAPASSDISVWQFIGPLLIGARTVVADHAVVCDPAALLQLLRTEGVTLIELVPIVLGSLLDYVSQLPVGERTIPSLEWAMVTGEAACSNLVNRWLDFYPGVPLVNAYGPTEASDDVTQAILDRPLAEGCSSVPIGHPLPNLSVYVLDHQLQLVPIGVPGEICVSGIGVGAGYLGQPEKTRECFVANPFARLHQGPVLYRTGDRGRWLPDGNLECLERLDQQVKLRGFRIELGEIETAIRMHPAVSEAAVAIRDDAVGGKQLCGYVVVNPQSEPIHSIADTLQREQIELWQVLHEDSYQSVEGDETFNTIGWDSNYTGAPLPEEDMREYVENTVDRIASLGSGRLLEIGCGAGLLLFPLSKYFERYTGTDLSKVTITRLRNLQRSESVLARFPNLTEARFLHCQAHDFEGLGNGQFETVALASVIQYFPSIDYLLQVLDGVFNRALTPGGSVFIGDVRSLPLMPVFAASLHVYKADEEEQPVNVAERARLHLAHEQELAVAPAFFLELKRRYPVISDVQILPKRGRQINEMSLFRYDVVIRTDLRPAPINLDWTDWRDTIPSLASLRRQLLDFRPSALALRNVQNKRLYKEVIAAGWLHDGMGAATVGAFRNAVHALPEAGLDPEDLWDLGVEMGYRVDLSLAGGHADGSFDVVLRPADSDLPAVSFASVAEHEVRTLGWSRYANCPLQEKLSRHLIPQLREFLKAKLPLYMIPSSFLLLGALPVSPAGKLDRASLPTPRVSGTTVADVALPRDAEERSLVEIWSEVLGVTPIGINDNFFDLGGHSLKATQVISRIHKAHGVPLALRELFSSPTVSELAAVLRSALRAHFVAIPKAEPAAHYPLSHGQRRLWVLSQLPDASTAYNMPMALLLRGVVDAAALQNALRWLAVRHESLRTAFVFVGDEPRQWIAPRIPVHLIQHDLSEENSPERLARRLAHEDAETPFDLSRPGLWRCSLLKLGSDRFVLLFNMHHIISDGWSMDVLEQEIALAYSAYKSGRLPEAQALEIQYRDYACWQHDYLGGEIAARSRQYWHAKLSGELPLLNLASDFRRPAVKTYRGANLRFHVDPSDYAAFTALARNYNASEFMCLLALIKVLLYRHTGQADLIVGTPIAGRDHADLESQIGFFVNTLPLRDTVEGSAPFARLLEMVRSTVSEAYEHQSYPFDLLVDELRIVRDVGRSPMFDVVVVMQSRAAPGSFIPGLQVESMVDEYPVSKFDLSFTLEPSELGLRVDITYNPDLFVRERIERYASHFNELLKGVLVDASISIDRLPMLSLSERARVLRDPWVEFPAGKTLIDLFEAQVVRNPDAIALVFPDTSVEVSPFEAGPRATLTYSDLNVRANQLAHYLRNLGLGSKSLVGLCLSRRFELIIGILGILKAGAAYVPLDPAHPADRRVSLACDAEITLLLTESRRDLQWPDLNIPTVDLDGIADCLAAESRENPSPCVHHDDLAYVIYTSGSTGQPKGVTVTHQNVVRLFQATESLFDFDADDVCTLFHSVAFDFSVWEIWGALLYGARLVIVPYWVSRSPPEFHRLLGREGVSVLNQTPSAFFQLMKADEETDARLRLRYVIFGGETLDPGALEPWFNRHGDKVPRLINMYGITETTVHVTYRPITKADCYLPGSPIGRPLSDLKVHILDTNMEPVAIGVAGEMFVGGGGVARGYLNRAELESERFVADPFSADSAARLYRTGDLARFLADGEIEYLGRRDQQVQIRGFRVELGEVEAALRQIPGVEQVAAVIYGERESLRIAAYYSAQEDMDSMSLRERLALRLPEHMVPSAFVRLDRLPLTINGKLDFEALPDPSTSRLPAKVGFAPARNDTERTVASIFCEVLGLEHVGLYDNFFDLGANSLLLMQVHRALQQSLGSSFSVVNMFQFPTVAALARSLSVSSHDGKVVEQAQERAEHQKAAQRRRKARKQ